jgi:hypothetical protein
MSLHNFRLSKIDPEIQPDLLLQLLAQDMNFIEHIPCPINFRETALVCCLGAVS